MALILIMESHDEVQFEYSQITSQIFVGANFCCQTHFDQELLSQGITADVSLEEEQIDSPLGVSYFLWLPVKDETAPTQKQLKVGVDFLAEIIKLGEKVYVHCRNGHGRSPTLVAAYFVSLGMEVDEAIEKIKASRPEAHLVLGQIEALRTFAKKQKPKISN